MTDEWKLLSLLDAFGIEYSHEDDSIILKAGSVRVDGYPYFVTRWNFTSDGSFVSVGIWE